MRFGSTLLFSAVVLTCAVPGFASAHTRRGPTSQHLSSKKSHPAAVKAAVVRGIDADRATQIQTALISHGYLSGTPSGAWNPETEEALRKLQSDNGWQTKFVPDSRAIIKLGLGPGSPTPDAAVSSGASAGSAVLPEAEPTVNAR